jgi:UDP-3-O-acyl N-acetylglucosamine deacetylase
MLAIGRALMTSPRYLLLDEPSLGLAPLVVAQIRDLLASINRQGTSVLLVEQNASMALSIAGHGYVMEVGKLVLDKPAAVLAQDEDVREFYLGLHSGGRTGMVIQPLPPDTGIHFLTLPRGVTMPAHVSAVAETDYATTLTRGGESIRTVEHLLSALHAAGVTNLLVKVHGEIPVLDGSALSFLERIEQVGVVKQDAPAREIVIDRRYELGEGRKSLVVEPADVFSVSYQLRYPPPVGEQFYDFVLADCDAYREEIAPARTFGFMRDLKMINELGLGTGGRLDNFILVGEDDVINTDLRFPDEFVRHKILDIIGDLYLLGYPMRAKVTAELTGHRDNIEIQRRILAANT